MIIEGRGWLENARIDGRQTGCDASSSKSFTNASKSSNKPTSDHLLEKNPISQETSKPSNPGSSVPDSLPRLHPVLNFPAPAAPKAPKPSRRAQSYQTSSPPLSPNTPLTRKYPIWRAMNRGTTNGLSPSHASHRANAGCNTRVK